MPIRSFVISAQALPSPGECLIRQVPQRQSQEAEISRYIRPGVGSKGGGVSPPPFGGLWGTFLPQERYERFLLDIRISIFHQTLLDSRGRLSLQVSRGREMISSRFSPSVFALRRIHLPRQREVFAGFGQSGTQFLRGFRRIWDRHRGKKSPLRKSGGGLDSDCAN